jgi:hypothetical protein
MEIAEPKLVKSRIDNALPNWAFLKTDKVLPIREADRRLKDEPNFKKSNTDKLPENKAVLFVEVTLKELPSLTKLRTESVEPILFASRTEKQLPNRITERIERELPKRM